MADSQVPWNVDAPAGAITEAAWQSKPSRYLVTTEDRMIPPPAQHTMANRIGAAVAPLIARSPGLCSVRDRYRPLGAERGWR